MKSLVAIFSFVLFAVTFTHAQQSAHVIAVVNSASWCPACKAHGSRVENNIVPAYMNNPNCKIVVNDVTDDQTMARSREKLAEAGIENLAAEFKATGVIYFVNSNSGKVISTISVAKPDAEIKAAFEEALKRS